MLLKDVIIVLSRPSEAGNVGAVCRAMKNMGLSRLYLVKPEFTSSGFGNGGSQAIIEARAVHAKDVWEEAKYFNSLEEAVKNCSLVIGTTRRRGRHRKQVSMTPWEIAAMLKDKPGPAALVFGNERTGLEDEELELCNLASHIPVNEAFPSLNLSHALMIYAYELNKNLTCKEAVKGQWVALDQEAIQTLVKEISDHLKSIGFYKKRGREEQEQFFQDIFSRSGITEREGQYFSKVILKAARLNSSEKFVE